MSRNDYEAGIELVATTENTVMCRTFSKIHGLASLRVGWMYAPAHVIDAINRIRGPFNVSTPAMLAAVASLADTAILEQARAHNEQWRGWLTEEIGKLGLKVTPSVANFVLIHFPQDKGRTADDADAFLTKRGLVLRGLKNYKLPHALRLTVGTEEANRLVVAGLRDFLGSLSERISPLPARCNHRPRADRLVDRARHDGAWPCRRARRHRRLGRCAAAREGARARAPDRRDECGGRARTPISSLPACRSARAARSRRISPRI